MNDILVPLTNYLLFLGSGAVLTLMAISAHRNWRRATEDEPAVPPASAEKPPEKPRREIGFVLVDAPFAEAFLRDNPDMMRADQCREFLGSFADDATHWLSTFDRLLSRATLAHPGKVPVFYLRREQS